MAARYKQKLKLAKKFLKLIIFFKFEHYINNY
jgi:hypothetical protein